MQQKLLTSIIIGLFLSMAIHALAAIRINDDLPDNLWPSIVVDHHEDTHMTWSNRSEGNYEIYYNKSINGVWVPAHVNISHTPGTSSWSSVTFDNRNDNVYVVWEDYNSQNRQVILYNKCVNGSWSSPVAVVDNNNCPSLPILMTEVTEESPELVMSWIEGTEDKLTQLDVTPPEPPEGLSANPRHGGILYLQ